MSYEAPGEVTVEPADVRRKQRIALAVVWSALFIDYSLMTVVIPIFPELNATEVQTGVLFSSKAAVQIFSAPMVASVVDGYGLLPLVLGLGIEVLTNLVFAFTNDYSTWLVCRATQGVASAFIISSGFLHIQQLHAGDNAAMGEAMGTVTTGIISGVVFGPAVGGALYSLSKPLPFFTLSALAALVLVAVACLARSNRRRRRDMDGGLGEMATTPKGSAWSKARGLCYDWQIVLVLGALFFANAAISCLEATIGMFTVRALNKGPEFIGLLFTLAAVPSVTGAKIAGRLGLRFKRWRVITAGMLIQGGFFALGPKGVVPILVISLLGLGLGMGLVDGTAPALLARRSEERHGGTGVVYTMSTTATQLGFLCGPVGGSAIMSAYDFGTMSLFLGALMCAYAPLFLLLRREPESGKERRDDEGLGAVSEEEGKGLLVPDTAEESPGSPDKHSNGKSIYAKSGPA